MASTTDEKLKLTDPVLEFGDERLEDLYISYLGDSYVALEDDGLKANDILDVLFLTFVTVAKQSGMQTHTEMLNHMAKTAGRIVDGHDNGDTSFCTVIDKREEI